MDYPVYNQKGEKKGNVTLPHGVFDVRWNPDLVHQVAFSMSANQRVPSAHAKDRSEVSGGGRKPWRQKGTGRARHGSRRSPLWVGGGATFGPRNERITNKKINKKMKAQALVSALSAKARDGEVLFLDTLSFDEGKTRSARAALEGISAIPGFEKILAKRKNSAIIFLSEKKPMLARGFANFGNIELEEVRNMNLLDILNFKHVVIVDPDIFLKHIKSAS